MQEALKENESKLSNMEKKMEELFENYHKKIDGIERKVEHDKIQSKIKGSQKMKHNATTSHKMENTPHKKLSHIEVTNQETKVMLSHILKKSRLIYPASTTHPPYYIVIFGLSGCTIFSHIIPQMARFSTKT
jgi:hypothetical protein